MNNFVPHLNARKLFCSSLSSTTLLQNFDKFSLIKSTFCQIEIIFDPINQNILYSLYSHDFVYRRNDPN